MPYILVNLDLATILDYIDNNQYLLVPFGLFMEDVERVLSAHEEYIEESSILAIDYFLRDAEAQDITLNSVKSAPPAGYNAIPELEGVTWISGDGYPDEVADRAMLARDIGKYFVKDILGYVLSAME